MRRRDLPRAWREPSYVTVAHQEGRDAGLAGVSRDCNPYDSHGPRARAWDRGWRHTAGEPGFATNLRSMRDARGWTQNELARRLGVSQLAVSNWERGTRRPKFQSLTRLQEVFGCTMDALTRGE